MVRGPHHPPLHASAVHELLPSHQLQHVAVLLNGEERPGTAPAPRPAPGARAREAVRAEREQQGRGLLIWWTG